MPSTNYAHVISPIPHAAFSDLNTPTFLPVYYDIFIISQLQCYCFQEILPDSFLRLNPIFLHDSKYVCL